MVGEGVPVTRVPQTLRQVVAERRHKHVVNSVWRDVGCRRCHRCRGQRSRPCISDEVRILRTELQSSLGTVVHFDPEPERAFDRALGLATTLAERPKIETVTRRPDRRREGFGIASRINKGRRSVANYTGGDRVDLIAISPAVISSAAMDGEQSLSTRTTTQTLAPKALVSCFSRVPQPHYLLFRRH